MQLCDCSDGLLQLVADSRWQGCTANQNQTCETTDCCQAIGLSHTCGASVSATSNSSCIRQSIQDPEMLNLECETAGDTFGA